MTHLDKIQKNILYSVSNALFLDRYEIDTTEIPSTVKEAIRQGVTLPVVWAMNLPSENPYYAKVQKLKDGITKRNLQIEWAHRYAAEKLSEAKIPYVILKGTASALYYPNPEMRQLGDVDVLVPARCIKRATELFVSDGYKLSHENHESHVVLKKDRIRIELHFTISGIPKTKQGQIIKDYFHSIFKDSVEYEGVRYPDEFHHLFILLLHTAHHIKYSGIGLRHLCDYTVFISRYSEYQFVRLYADQLQRAGLYNFALVLAQLSKECFGMPAFSDYEPELAQRLLLDIFNSGNFGNKNPHNTQQTFFADKGFVSNVNRTVRGKWKSAEKHPILLPVGYVFFGGRFVLRSMLGKREKINIPAAKRDAQKRKKLYNSLKLFKEEI